MKTTFILGFLTMAAIGWNLGDSGKSAPAVDPPLPSERPARPVRRVKATSGPGDADAQRLQAVRGARNSEERMRAAIDLASSIPPSDFPAWMKDGWFNLREGESLTLFTKILRERWKQEDPGGLAIWSLESKSKDAIPTLASWAESEPRKVLDFFKSHPDDSIEIRVLASVAKNDPGLALQRFKEMVAAGMSPSASGSSGELIQQLAKQSPAALESALDSLPLGLKTQAEVMLISQKMENSFSGELQKLVARPDGMTHLRSVVTNQEAFKGKLFDELPNLPVSWRISIGSNPYAFIGPESAGKWVGADLESYGFTAEQARSIRTQAISIFSMKDPEAALRALDEMNLPPGSRKPMIQNMFQFVRDKPETSTAMLAQLQSEEERKIARGVIGNGQIASVPRIDQPADWLAKVAATDLDQPGSAQYLSVLKHWDQDKLAALAEQFKSMPDSSKGKMANYIAGNIYSDNGPLEGEAIRYLVSHPMDDPLANPTEPSSPQEEDGMSKSIGMASAYVGEVARKDPRAASAWLQSLPEGEAKLWARKSLHSVWTKYDPKAAEQWLKSLPADIQSKIQELGKISEE